MKSKQIVLKELFAERDELMEKIVKLTDLLTTPHNGISSKQRSWMNVQLHSMKNYARCLRKRVEDLRGDKNE